MSMTLKCDLCATELTETKDRFHCLLTRYLVCYREENERTESVDLCKKCYHKVLDFLVASKGALK